MSSRPKWIEERSRQADCSDAITDMRVGSKERLANALLNRMSKPEKNYNKLSSSDVSLAQAMAM